MNKHVDIALSREFLSLVRNNQREEACQQLLDNIKSNSQPNQSYFFLARIKFRAKKFEEALSFFAKIEGSYQKSYKYWYLRGKCAYAISDYETARNCFQQANIIHTLPKKGSALLAVLAYKTGHFEMAAHQFASIEEFSKEHYYLKKYSAFSKALITGDASSLGKPYKWTEHVIANGIIQCRKKNLIKEANFLLQFFLSAPVLAFERSYFLDVKIQNLQKRTAALNEYLSSSHIDNIDFTKYSPELKSIFASILFSADFYNEASILYAELLLDDRLDVADLRRAIIVFSQVKNYEEAYTACHKLVKLAPKSKSPFFSLAKKLMNRGDGIRAIDCIVQHLNTNPRDIQAILWLAELGIAQKNKEYSEKQLVKAREICQRAQKPPTEFRKLKKLLILYEDTFGRGIQPNSTVADYSYIDWSRIPVPTEFQLSGVDINTDSPNINKKSVFSAFSVALSALILREMTTRFGRNGLGYMWAVIRQMVFIGFFFLLFELRGRHLPYGVSILAFLITGINSFFIFRNTVGQLKKALKSNINLLYFRQISPFSIYASRAILETLTGVFIFALLVLILRITGEQIRMTSLLQVLSVLLLLGAFGACYGLFIATASTFIPALDAFEAVIGRVLFFTSGIFFYANELPKEIREVLMWNPLLHLIELLREGFFDTYTAKYASLGYVSGWLISFFFFALVLERIGRRRILER